MRRVFLNGRFLSQPITGVQRYAVEAVKALDSLLGEGAPGADPLSLSILAPRGVRAELSLKRISVHEVGRLGGHLWEQLELPLHAREGLLVSFGNAAPLLRRDQIVTIHDAGVWAQPRSYSFAFGTWYRLLLRGLSRRAACILTVSSFSLGEILRFFPRARGKARVVSPGADHLDAVEPEEAVFRRSGIGERPYLLAVGSRNPAKNLQGVASAAGRLREGGPDLVIVGEENRRVFRTLRPLPAGRARWTGRVSDGELKALYRRAACLVYPSFYEGFGLPPLEAMASGCPVIASRAASLPEVLGEAALYCDPHSPEDIAKRIEELAGDGSLREDLRRRGLERARGFRWRDCARGILSAIEERCG